MAGESRLKGMTAVAGSPPNNHHITKKRHQKHKDNMCVNNSEKEGSLYGQNFTEKYRLPVFRRH